MKNLVLTAFLSGALASLASGCLIVSDDGGDPIVDTGVITVEWSLVAGDANDPAACPPGANTIAVISEDSAGAQTTDLFDCDVGIGTTADLYDDDYYVWVELRYDDNTDYVARSLGQEVSVYAGQETIADVFEFSLDRGAFDVAWEIWEGDVASECDVVGATDFSLDYTDVNGDLFGPDLFACTDYMGTSPTMALGAWSVSPSIIDETELAIAVGASIDTTLDFGNHYRDLGTVVLDTQAAL